MSAPHIALIMAGPGLPAGKTVGNNVSLVDIFPTLIKAATQGVDPGSDLANATDGRSLWGLAIGRIEAADDLDEAISEYCAECASHPCFMIRRGPYKYIHCDIDQPLLFNLEDDPNELTNLAADPTMADVADSFAAEVRQRWDSDRIRQDVMATQKQRHAVYDAMQDGTLTSWDFQPKRDAANEYVRNHMDWTVAAANSRFPPHQGGDNDT